MGGMFRRTLTMCAVLLTTMVICVPAIQCADGAPSASRLAELWVGPVPIPGDLFACPFGKASVRPATDAGFDVVKRDTGGFRVTKGLERR